MGLVGTATGCRGHGGLQRKGIPARGYGRGGGSGWAPCPPASLVHAPTWCARSCCPACSLALKLRVLPGHMLGNRPEAELVLERPWLGHVSRSHDPPRETRGRSVRWWRLLNARVFVRAQRAVPPCCWVQTPAPGRWGSFLCLGFPCCERGLE